MRKKKVYNVTGVLDTKPENLPEGLKVDELEVDDMKVLEIGPFHFADSSMNDNGLYIREERTPYGNRHLTREQTTNLRDFLNEILGEKIFKGRVLVDGVNDVWFEFAPNVWTQGNDFSNTNPNPWERAQDRHADDSDCPALTKQSVEYISREYGPVKFIENIWE